MKNSLATTWRMLGLLTAAAILLPACKRGASPHAAPGAEPIRIGEYASLTGKDATFGISSHEGTRLAIEELNAAGGVLGRQIELLTEDTQCKAGARRGRLQPLDGGGADLPEIRRSHDLALLHEPRRHEDRRLHLPRLLHRSLSRHRDGELRPQHAQGQARGDLHRRQKRSSRNACWPRAARS
jgi:hypothetical protein